MRYPRGIRVRRGDSAPRGRTHCNAFRPEHRSLTMSRYDHRCATGPVHSQGRVAAHPGGRGTRRGRNLKPGWIEVPRSTFKGATIGCGKGRVIRGTLTEVSADNQEAGPLVPGEVAVAYSALDRLSCVTSHMKRAATRSLPHLRQDERSGLHKATTPIKVSPHAPEGTWCVYAVSKSGCDPENSVRAGASTLTHRLDGLSHLAVREQNVRQPPVSWGSPPPMCCGDFSLLTSEDARRALNARHGLAVPISDARSVTSARC